MSLFNLRGVERRNASGPYIAFENPAVPLSSIGLEAAFGNLFKGGESGENVTQTGSLVLPIVYRCVSLLSGLVAGCDLNVYRKPFRKPVQVPSLTGDQGLYTPYELWELVMWHLLLWGNAYLLKVRDPMDRVIDLRPINPSLVDVDLVAGDGDQASSARDKVFIVRIPARPGDNSGQVNKKVVLTTWEVCHIPGPGFDGLTGLSPIMLAKQTIGTGIASDKLAAKLYSQGALLNGILKVQVPLTDQNQADMIRSRWRQKNAGVIHAGDVAVLDSETEFQPLTIPPEAMQFLESRRWQTTEIARLYGIPPHLVGDVERSTSWGTGIEQQNTGFVTYSVKQWTKRIEQRVSREVVATRGQYAEFDISELLRGDTQERFAAYANAIQWGWLTRNEVRLRENLEPIEGLDEPLTPVNMAAGTVKIDPATGQPMGNPKGDLDGPLTTTVKPGSGKQQSGDEVNE